MQRRLAIADRMASAGTLAAGVAHELNNPLAFVRANLEYLLETLRLPLGSEEQQALFEARAGAVRMQEIVRGMKLFSRIEEETVGPVALDAVIGSAVRLAQNEIRHRARLELAVENVPPVSGSEARLAQVFVNLLVNAAQAIPVGAADANRIRVSARQHGDSALVEIADTGCGIPPEVLRRIFDPFFTTKPVGVGTGLGMAICHGIITGLGGQISVESEQGRGTRVRVVLPLHPEVAPSEPTRKPAAVPVRGRILVIDDEPFVTRAVRRALEPLGEVVTLNEARRAIDLLDAERPFDVILCDLMMPEMTGMELYETLARCRPELARRMIFMSGGAFTANARGFLERFPEARVDKPFEVDALRTIVGTRLREGHRSA
jgi:CheY-like chemotaxis protein/anti-sigma regulatory factor (Ser/Thr protein kinase)